MMKWLFLLHLSIPAFLLFDAIEAYQRGFQGRVARALIAVSLLWIIAGLIMFVFRQRPRVAPWLTKTTLFTLASLVCVVILETGITMIMPVYGFGLKRMHRPPNYKIQFVKNPLPVPRKTIDTVFTTNEIGVRGQPIREKEGAYRILAIGGSTTECFVLDDSTAWPAVLGKILSQDGRRFWVQNTGLAGHTSTDHLYMLRTNPLVGDADLIPILVGANDLGAALAFQGQSVQGDLERRSAETYGVFPRYSRSAIYKLLFFLTTARSELRYDFDKFYVDMRAKRRQGPILPVPDLGPAIQEYGQRIQALARECKQLQKRCLLMTQPMLWRHDLNDREIAALWLGYLGPIENPVGYVSPAELEKAMGDFNRKLLQVAASEQVESLDLAAMIPQNLDSYYDDAHYTDEGAHIVAQAIATYLKPRLGAGR